MLLIGVPLAREFSTNENKPFPLPNTYPRMTCIVLLFIFTNEIVPPGKKYQLEMDE